MLRDRIWRLCHGASLVFLAALIHLSWQASPAEAQTSTQVSPSLPQRLHASQALVLQVYVLENGVTPVESGIVEFFRVVNNQGQPEMRPIGSAAVSTGIARLHLSRQSVGEHRFYFRYLGNSTHAPGQAGHSRPVVVTTDRLAPAVAIEGPETGAADIEVLTYQVRVYSGSLQQGTPTGSVSLYLDGIEFQRALLSPEFRDRSHPTPDGVAVIRFSLPSGQRRLTARYHGDTAFLPAETDEPFEVDVQPRAIGTRTTIYAPGRVITGTQGVIEARVQSDDGTTPFGRVRFLEGQDEFASANLGSDGWARVTMAAPQPGRYMIRAEFVGATAQGRPWFMPSISSPIPVVVAPSVMASRVALDVAPRVELHRPLRLVARLSANDGIPGGHVSFRAGGQELASARVEGGVAEAVIDTLSVGTYSITAHYLSNGGYDNSVSPARTVTVEPLARAGGEFLGGGAVFGFSDACRPAWPGPPEGVRIRYSPSELNDGPPSQVSIIWPTGSEHIALWGDMLPSEQFRGGTGRQMWSYFVFYPLRPLVRVVQRQVTQPANASLANAQELVLRLRVQNFGAIPGCTAVVAGTLRRN